MSDFDSAAIDSASDDDLMHRLFDLATHGDHESSELLALDAAVYSRLAAAYGETTPTGPTLAYSQAA
ncbi:hypothetical protein [Montanilutibacter psychrotolerans]|uniref:Uncharacterized protein n=1 Tax=Montanilutibacter psychrotolerans TaxID=1327343 RepID=A0A3M8SVA4_9GAMM|nr:hypothetical protein [Lysobacter psychrotolerans]RNF85271.1 hypothetical protein EER27_05770 [Lysobacter psychrotolerans]